MVDVSMDCVQIKECCGLGMLFSNLVLPLNHSELCVACLVSLLPASGMKRRIEDSKGKEHGL